MEYSISPVTDFESCFIIVVALDEDGIHLIRKQYNLNFVTYEIIPGIYSTKDLS